MKAHWTVLVATVVTGGWLLGMASTARAHSGSDRYIPAHRSNYTARSSRRIDRIVIHTIEGSEGSAISWFRNPRSNVSAHYIVSHSGRVTRMLRDSDVGWHVRGWNGRAIGIECEGYAHRDTWTDAQMSALADLVRTLANRHSVPVDRTHIVGHVEVPGNTHTDPGPYFDWNRLLREVRSGSNGSSGPTASRRRSTPRSSTRGARVTASRLNVRTGPWSTRLGSVSRGDRFVLTGRTRGRWREIFYAGRRAWVHGAYLSGAGGTGQRVTASWLNVRRGPSTGYSRRGAVGNGQKYFQVGARGAWRRIQFADRPGWAHGAYLSRERVSP